ncbi:hypothetical protein C0995_008507 [Termitomyces sp. Mi166|nr:hypothetical protein C0995_008507 [Termitomyces sp. Mi166\
MIEVKIPKKSMARRFIEGRTANTMPASNPPTTSITLPVMEAATRAQLWTFHANSSIFVVSIARTNTQLLQND